MSDPPDPLDLGGVRTYPLASRKSKVTRADFARPLPRGSRVGELLDSLPRILGAQALRDLAAEVLRARSLGKPILWGLGAHVLKVGLSPVLVDLMTRPSGVRGSGTGRRDSDG